jgi:hypothetical protein
MTSDDLITTACLVGALVLMILAVVFPWNFKPGKDNRRG